MTNSEIIDEMIPSWGGMMIIYMYWEEAKINEFLETKSEEFASKWFDYILKSHQFFQIKCEYTTASNFIFVLKHKTNYQQLKDYANDQINYNRQLPEWIAINDITIIVENDTNSSWSWWFFGGMF